MRGGLSSARLGIVEAIGATPGGTAEIWRFLLDIDWQATITASLLPIDHPLSRALRVEELREGAIDRADSIFRRTGVAPWCPEIF